MESAVQCPNNDCGARVLSQGGVNVLSRPFAAYANGTSGYNVPNWGKEDVYSEDGKTLEKEGKWGISGWYFMQAGGGQDDIPWLKDVVAGKVTQPQSDKDCSTYLAKLF